MKVTVAGNVKDIVNDSKIIKNFFYSQFNKRLKLNFYDDAAQCNILKKTTIVEKKEIICYRLNKKMTKFKYVKIILIDNMIFYYNYNHKTKNFIFKKIIFIEQLYPKEIKVPFLPVNVPLPIKSSQNKIFQLQITSALHNNQLLYDFYTSEQQDFSYFGNYISSKQNLRSIDSIYEMGEEIGHGKFGKVMIATHKLSGEKVSISCLAMSTLYSSVILTPGFSKTNSATGADGDTTWWPLHGLRFGFIDASAFCRSLGKIGKE